LRGASRFSVSGLFPEPRLGLVKCHMSAGQVLNAPTY